MSPIVVTDIRDSLSAAIPALARARQAFEDIYRELVAAAGETTALARAAEPFVVGTLAHSDLDRELEAIGRFVSDEPQPPVDPIDMLLRVQK